MAKLPAVSYPSQSIHPTSPSAPPATTVDASRFQRLRVQLSHLVEARRQAAYFAAVQGIQLESAEVCLGVGRCLALGSKGHCAFCVAVPDDLNEDEIEAFAARIVGGN